LAAVYGINDGALVIELVEGQTLADRATFLHEGRVEFFGPWAELERSEDHFLSKFLLEDGLIPALDVPA
jgi:ABC-type transporter Mla maintaining outer membrane lipid asymmetry ATPase subunit MlaF